MNDFFVKELIVILLREDFVDSFKNEYLIDNNSHLLQHKSINLNTYAVCNT